MKRLRLKNSAVRTAPVDPIPDEPRANAPAPQSMVPSDNGAPMGAASQGLILVIAIGVVLIFVAFWAGMYVANVASEAPLFDEVNRPTGVAEEVEEDVVQNDDREPYALSIEWFSVASQPKSGMHATLHRVLYDDDFFIGADEEPLSLSYTLGIVRGGAYDGYRLTQQIAAMPGMGTYYETYYVLIKDGNVSEDMPGVVLIDMYASSVPDVFSGSSRWESATKQLGEMRMGVLEENKIVVDWLVTIPEFEHDTAVRDVQGRPLILSDMWQRVDFPTPFTFEPTVSTTLTDGTKLSLYNPPSDHLGPAMGRHQFYRVREDGRMLFYDAVIPFFVSESSPVGQLGTPRIDWNDGTRNDRTYIKGRLGGCGITTITNVLSDDDLARMPELVQVGEASVGAVPIFEPETYDHPYYDSAFNAWTYNDAVDEKLTYADFADKHPYIYFKDAFGRWVEMISSDAVPPVECGKPVIYLYPEREMDVDVRVEPVGGFSKTEPEYRDGWRVTASPDGRLVNRDDGRAYPYLFWEGRGGLYAEPSNYWIVARADVPSFLRDTLGRMGLNARETEDFMEFWGPRMQVSPWYKIGFHGTRVMDMLAPMSLSVRPDSVLRVLMDYSELDAPVDARQPRLIPRFDRRSFTVVEWGGVLR